MTGSWSHLVLMHMRFLYVEMNPSETIGVYLQKEVVSAQSVEVRDPGSHGFCRSVPIQQTECQCSALEAGEIHVVQLIICGIFSLLAHWSFFICLGLDTFLDSEKGNKMFYAPNSNISQLCGVVSKLLSDLHGILSVRMLCCGASSRT